MSYGPVSGKRKRFKTFKVIRRSGNCPGTIVEALEALWELFGNVCIDEEERIESEFLHFGIGTHREEIWRWFDETHPRGVAYLMYGESAFRHPKL